MEKGHSDTVTEGIRIRVGARFVPEQSDPELARYVFAYKVAISNEGDQAARLLARHWIVVDAIGERRDVRGPGVVGEQPLLEPGGSFEYDSGCQLATQWGTMEGTYRMQRPDGTQFEASVGRFFLAPNVAPFRPQSAKST
jgi:ApaG protein